MNPFTRLITIITLLFSNSLFSQTRQAAASARLVIDLGSSPWKFKKLNLQNDEDTIILKNMTESGASMPQIQLAELKAPTRVSLLRSYFADTSVYQAFYKIEASADKINWRILADKTSAGDVVSYLSTSSVKSTANTVGYVEKRKAAYINVPLNVTCQFIKLTVTKILKRNNTPLLISQGKLSLYSTDGNTPQERDYQSARVNDSNWENVGIPHCFNDMDTYLNSNNGRMWRGAVWYRKHLKYYAYMAGKKIFLEFDGVNIGATVYINGKFKPGNMQVKQPSDVTHVGGFLPFLVDITNEMIPGADNIIAVNVSNAPNDFFTRPGFGVYDSFGMGWGGIVCPVRLYALNQIYIPLNSYSPLNTWGTYNAVISAGVANASIRLQTNVKNDGNAARNIVLQSSLIDKNNRVVTSVSMQKTVAAGVTVFFDTVLKVINPHLWYPNNSPYGKPYLYRIVRTVKANGVALDEQSENLGIRTITWDSSYCYVNHKKHLLKGFGNRNSYPALGSAVPKEIQWNDIKLIADAGGNTLRVGHVPATRQTLEACDVYGVLVMDNSGDNEWALKNEPANTYKLEYDRDMIVNFRNYACVAIWESNNGLAKDGVKYQPSKTQEMADQWDSLQHRIVSTRDRYPVEWDKSRPLMVSYSNGFKKVAVSPCINTEVYGAFWDGRRSFNIARDDYENEKAFSEWYVDNWLHDIDNGACGWIDWMLAETQGEGYTIYLNGKSKQRSLGSCAMDGNRFPKLKYNILKNALWFSFEVKPGVALQSTWNLKGIQAIDAWSNCPSTELFLNGKSLGKRSPNSRTKRCTWPDVVFEAGKLKIVGLDKKGRAVCADSVITAGVPDRIVLTVEKNLTVPDGSRFAVKANGSDVALIKAVIVDEKGNRCPDADNKIRFSVVGDADYKGSYNFYVDADKPGSYHSPSDHELAAEGGLMKVAIRSKFKSGLVVVNARADGLKGARTSYIIKSNL